MGFTTTFEKIQALDEKSCRDLLTVAFPLPATRILYTLDHTQLRLAVLEAADQGRLLPPQIAHAYEAMQ
jgi:hypothetical protein